MTNKEILLDILKHCLGDRLTKLEKKNNEQETSLKLISTSYNGFIKKLSDLNKAREQKIAKDKLEEQKKLAAKKAEEAKKNKKKETVSRTSRKSNINTTNKKNNDKIIDKKKNFTKTKSSAILEKKPLERKRGKSVTRLNTETNKVDRNTIGINNIRRKSIGNKKDTPATETKRRNTIGGGGAKKSLKQSKSMGKLFNKPTLKKANAGDDNKKKEIEEMQKIVNNIKIQNKDNENEENDKENEKEENKEEIEEPKEEESKEEIKVELPPPTLSTCQQNGILEKNIIPFLTKKEQIILFSCNRDFAPLAIGLLKDKLSSLKKVCDVFIGQTMDDKINSLEAKYSQEELNAPLKNFELSRGCSKAMGLLDEELYLRVFFRAPPEKTLEEIVIVYKLFCQLLNKEDFVEIKDDKIFWEKFSKFILENKGDKLSVFCNKCVTEFNFDNKNILKLKEMSKNKADKLKPAYFGKICGTTGLFVFLIKDTLEYCGAIEDKKTQGNRIKSNYIYQKSLFDDLNKYIKFLQDLNNKKDENNIKTE